jgi:prepilin-type N-terminal cleavage/methylation domain-containing protein
VNPARRQAGFTLLELLVATSLSLVLAGLLLAIVNHTLGLWQRQRGAVDTAAQARLVLDFLERDLQGALHRADGGRWLAVDILDSPAALGGHAWLVQPGMKPGGADSLQVLGEAGGGMATARFGLSGCWLRFVSSPGETADAWALPAVVSYHIVRRPVAGVVSADNTAEVRYRLYRTAVTPAATFANGYDVRASSYTTSSGRPAADRSPAAVTAPAKLEALADNVVDFGVWLYARNADGSLRRTFPLSAATLTHTAPRDDDFPVVADVMVRIVTEAGAMELAAMEQGRLVCPPEHATDAAWWWAVVECHSQVFTRRIQIMGGGL